MERVVRSIGIGVIVVLALAAVGLVRRTIDGIESDGPYRAEVAADVGIGEVASSADGAAPRYLAFRPSVPARIYTVADLPDSRDRDITPRVAPGVDYPVETDIVPDHSLAGGFELPPGLYATAFGVEDCTYQLRRVMRNRRESVIGEDRLRTGRMLVSINEVEPDSFSSAAQCGTWSEWSPLVEPLTVTGDGDYWIGDLATGTWTVPEGCQWETVVSFRGARLADVEDAGVGPAPLVVDDETLGVRIRGCSRPLRLETGRS